jgi:hypothetical protein
LKKKIALMSGLVGIIDQTYENYSARPQLVSHLVAGIFFKLEKENRFFAHPKE